MKHVFTFLAFVLMSSGFAQIPEDVSTDGLVAWYPFSGDASDLSEFGNDGVVQGPFLTTDRFGSESSAYGFDGVDDYIVIEGSDALEFEDGDFTFSGWFQTSVSKRQWVVSNYLTFGNNPLWMLGVPYHGAPSSIGIDVRDGINQIGESVTNEDVVDGSWHHSVFVRSGDSIELYLDGVSIYSLEVSNLSALTEGNPYYIGTDNLNFQCWEGAIDDVGFWNRALTDEEILTLYNAPNPLSGCTDVDAENFNPYATIDNGTCEYCTVATPEVVSSFGETALLSAPELASNVTWSTGEEGQQIEVSESGFYSSEWSLELSGVDSALGFVESNAWLSIPSLALPEEYSLQVWAHFPLPETSDGHNTFFSDWNSGGAADLVQLLFHESCGLGIGDQYEQGNCGPSGMFGTGVLASDVSEGWHLITASSTPAGTAFFIDDAEVGTVNHQVSGPIVAVGNNAGGNGVAPQQAGALSQARVWGGAMTSQHVVDAFHCNIASIDLELLAHWALDDTSEGGVDLSGGGHSGMLQNVSSPVETTYCFSCETKQWAVDFPEPNCGTGTVWDAAIEECVVANPSDTDFDGCVGMIDLLDLLSVFGTCNEAPWSCGEQLEYQGYDYETVQIGEQCWFAENARFLPEVSPVAQGSEVDGLPHAYVYGYDGSVVSEAVQSAGYANGALYNFDAVVSWEICPAGWYVPGDEDWMTLESFLGMDENELEWFYPEQGFERGADEEIGFKLKSVEWDGGNSTGFSALSNGWRWTGVFAYPEYTNFWTSTQISPEVSWARILREGESGIARQPYYPHFGKSVRCVQESE